MRALWTAGGIGFVAGVASGIWAMLVQREIGATERQAQRRRAAIRAVNDGDAA